MINSKSLTIISSAKNPIGIYRLRSDDTFGTTIKASGLRCSLNNMGVSANFLRPSSGAFSLSCLQRAMRFITSGILRSSLGATPTSHKHQRFLLFIYSTAPINRRIYFSESGSAFRKPSKSSSRRPLRLFRFCPQLCARFRSLLCQQISLHFCVGLLI